MDQNADSLPVLLKGRQGIMERKPRRNSPLRTLVFCVGLYVFDSLILGTPFFGVLVAFIALVFNLFTSLVNLLRTNRSSALRHGLKALICILTIVAIVGTYALDQRRGRANAERIIKAVEAYHGECETYPWQLEDLVPRFIPKIPRSSVNLFFYQYYYRRGREENQDPYLVWVAQPPFGRYLYNFETKEWHYLD